MKRKGKLPGFVTSTQGWAAGEVTCWLCLTQERGGARKREWEGSINMKGSDGKN